MIWELENFVREHGELPRNPSRISTETMRCAQPGTRRRRAGNKRQSPEASVLSPRVGALFLFWCDLFKDRGCPGWTLKQRTFPPPGTEGEKGVYVPILLLAFLVCWGLPATWC